MEFVQLLKVGHIEQVETSYNPVEIPLEDGNNNHNANILTENCQPPIRDSEFECLATMSSNSASSSFQDNIDDFTTASQLQQVATSLLLLSPSLSSSAICEESSALQVRTVAEDGNNIVNHEEAARDEAGDTHGVINVNDPTPDIGTIISHVIQMISSIHPTLVHNAEFVVNLRHVLLLMNGAINDLPRARINLKLSHDIGTHIFHINVSGLTKTDHRRVALEQALVLLIFLRPEGQQLIWTTTQHFLQQYPNFSRCNPTDLLKLLRFRNVLRVTLLLIPTSGHKHHVIETALRICEGPQARYSRNDKSSLRSRQFNSIFKSESSRIV